jgi:hypothetical protein
MSCGNQRRVPSRIKRSPTRWDGWGSQCTRLFGCGWGQWGCVAPERITSERCPGSRKSPPLGKMDPTPASAPACITEMRARWLSPIPLRCDCALTGRLASIAASILTLNRRLWWRGFCCRKRSQELLRISRNRKTPSCSPPIIGSSRQHPVSRGCSIGIINTVHAPAAPLFVAPTATPAESKRRPRSNHGEPPATTVIAPRPRPRPPA